MASGAVCVLPGIFPANINVAPNSPNARAKLKIPPDIMALAASGMEMNSKTFHSLAPSTRAAFSISRLTPSKPVFVD